MYWVQRPETKWSNSSVGNASAFMGSYLGYDRECINEANTYNQY